MSRTIRLLNNCIRLNNYRLQQYSKVNKELPKQYVPIVSTSPDYLIQNLKNSRTSQNVLNIVGAHYKIMNTKQLLQALRSIFTLQKYGSSNLATRDIVKNSDFEKLCHHLKSQAGLIEINEAIEALKVVSYLGVSPNSTIVQTLLQVIRYNINDLSLQQLMFLDFLLKQFKSSPLVEALLIAIPIVFEVHLPMHMDRGNVVNLIDYLQFISRKRVSEQCISLIVNNLNEYLENDNFLEPKLAKSIIWSICDMQENEFFESVLRRALNIVLSSIDSLTWQDLETTLSKLSVKYSSKCSYYYHDVFFDFCANYVTDKNLGFEEAIFTLRKLAKVNHTNDNLLNYTCLKCYEDNTLLRNASQQNMSTLITSLVLSEFRPIHWDFIKKEIINSSCFREYEKRDMLWLKLAAALCSLDIYKLDVLEKALSADYLKSIVKQQNRFDFDHFLLIYQAIATFHPNYLYLLPVKGFVDDIVSQIKPVEEYSFQKSLEKGLGGEKYVKTGLQTALGHHIDHVIVLRKGGYPIALSSNVQYLEDIEVPLESHLVLILALGSSNYTINTKRLKQTTAFTIKTLEAKGHSVIPVCLDIWNSLADFEKVPYLMQAIRLKIENEFQMSDSM
ncbi:hypothetical protein RN001_001508 [Aquatica leii]|uniref:RAP domain-containing protein n=1 Tax=Aquatica leii TaxID=1421715 RepID=A0AAN7PG36_9COLE|nr:hypothetical protein RN001_001508 [Aquatica leii]